MAQDVTPADLVVVGSFEMRAYWTTPDGDPCPGEWWAYYLGRLPQYVGMTRHLRTRLQHHARFWPHETNRTGTMFSAASEDVARSLERLLICCFDPPGNIMVPRLSWLERRVYSDLGRRFARGELRLCSSGCPALVAMDSPALIDVGCHWVPLTEPSPWCERHG